jgi:hypothetical protein
LHKNGRNRRQSPSVRFKNTTAASAQLPYEALDTPYLMSLDVPTYFPPEDDWHSTLVFFDTGSQETFVKQSLAKLIGTEPSPRRHRRTSPNASAQRQQANTARK